MRPKLVAVVLRPDPSVAPACGAEALTARPSYNDVDVAPRAFRDLGRGESGDRRVLQVDGRVVAAVGLAGVFVAVKCERDLVARLPESFSKSAGAAEQVDRSQRTMARRRGP